MTRLRSCSRCFLRVADEGGEARTHVAHVLVSPAQAVYKVVGLALEAPIGGSDFMMVDNILFLEGETSVGEVETYFVGKRSEAAHKEREVNNTE